MKANEDGMGFYCLNIFKCSQHNPAVDELLQHEILKDNQFGYREMMSEVGEEDRQYGCFNFKKINSSDFEVLNFIRFKSKVEKFWKGDDCGEDLPIFKKYFK